MVSSIITVLALLALIGGLATTLFAERQRVADTSDTHLVALDQWLPGFAFGLSVVSLIWLSIDRRHFPPNGLAESSIALATISIGLYLWFKKQTVQYDWFLNVGRLLTSVVLLYGIIQLWLETPVIGHPPLWLWGILARWLILAGIGGLLWLATLAIARLRLNIKSRAADEVSDKSLPNIDKRWQPFNLVLIIMGGVLYIARAWWGWGQPNTVGLAISVVVLLMLATAWLRFTLPQRALWTGSLTILAFIAALPMMVVIAS